MKIVLFYILFGLSGCSIYKSQFDCKPGKSVGCESVSTVNQLINEDSLDDFIAGRVSQKVQCNQLKEKMTIHFYEYRDEVGNIHLPHDVEVIL